jgi:hypothetical protein
MMGINLKRVNFEPKKPPVHEVVRRTQGENGYAFGDFSPEEEKILLEATGMDLRNFDVRKFKSLRIDQQVLVIQAMLPELQFIFMSSEQGMTGKVTDASPEHLAIVLENIMKHIGDYIKDIKGGETNEWNLLLEECKG